MSFSCWRLVLSFLMHGFKFDIYNLVPTNTCIFHLFLIFNRFSFLRFSFLFRSFACMHNATQKAKQLDREQHYHCVAFKCTANTKWPISTVRFELFASTKIAPKYCCSRQIPINSVSMGDFFLRQISYFFEWWKSVCSRFCCSLCHHLCVSKEIVNAYTQRKPSNIHFVHFAQ